jgi:Domain of unknown function (DUF4333)
MRSPLVRAAAVFVLVLATAACSKTLDSTELEGTLKDQLEMQLEVTGLSVECPDDIKAESGNTFECTATGSDGSTMTLSVSQTDDEGNLTWEITDVGTA